MRLSYLDGAFVPTDEMQLNLHDDLIGFIRGYRIFTACRTVNADYIFHEQAHIERLFYAAGQIGMELPYSKPELSAKLHEIVDKNKAESGDLLLEIIFTGGPAAPNGVAPAGPAKLIVLVFDLKLPPDRWYEQGVHLASFPHNRPYPTVKSMFYMGAVIAHQTVVKQQGADEALFVEESDGITVLEGTTFNVFLINHDNVLKTPALDNSILPGITRQVVIEQAAKLGLKTEETVLTLDHFRTCQGAFLTSSTRNVVPITRIDDFQIGEGKPEATTLQLLEAVRAYQADYRQHPTF